MFWVNVGSSSYGFLLLDLFMCTCSVYYSLLCIGSPASTSLQLSSIDAYWQRGVTLCWHTHTHTDFSWSEKWELKEKRCGCLGDTALNVILSSLLDRSFFIWFITFSFSIKNKNTGAVHLLCVSISGGKSTQLWNLTKSKDTLIENDSLKSESPSKLLLE